MSIIRWLSQVAYEAFLNAEMRATLSRAQVRERGQYDFLHEAF
jgi:hypothetical protein